MNMSSTMKITASADIVVVKGKSVSINENVNNNIS